MKDRLFQSRADEVTRLIVVRHGRTPANEEGRIGTRADIPLTAEGDEQARRAGERIRPFGPAAVYTSPQLRARLTADAIAAAVQLEPTIDQRLMEYHLGMLENKTLEEIAVEHPALWPDIEAWLTMRPGDSVTRPVVPESEPMDALVTRAASFKDAVLANHPGQTVVAVTHLAVIKALFTTLAGGSMADHSAFLADNASLSVIDFYNGMPVIRVFNDIAHLDMPLRYGKPVII